MSWLTPLTGAFLAAAVIPPLILLYFLKLRRRGQAIACTLLWQKSIEDLRANAPFQKLRRSLLLFLQLLALTLLILSVMQPQIQAGRNQGGKTVILVDNSASMTATDTDDGDDPDRTRLAVAKERAKDRIEELYGGGLLSRSPGETMVVAFSDRAEILCRFSRSKQELLDAIDRIQPTHGGTRFEEALKLARAYTTNVDPESDRPVGAPATLEVWTDGRIADIDDQVLRGETMKYHRLGKPEADNVGLGAIKVDRPYDRPSQVEVFASLINFNQAQVACDVQLSVDVTARAVRGIDVPAATIDPASGALVPGRQSLIFTPFDQPRGAVIEVAILRPDDLPVDNLVQEVVPPPKQLSVALVSPKSFLIQTVLEGMALRRLELLTESRYEALAERGGLEAYDVIVFDNYAPPEGLMPPGRYLTFGAAPPIEGLNEFGKADLQIVLDAHEQHPTMRFVKVDDLIVVNGRLIQPEDDIETIVDGSAGPIIVSVSRGPMQVMHVTFDPAESNWPFQRGWVTFVFNAIDYLGHVGEGLTSKGFKVGEALTTRLPSGASDVSLMTPDRQTIPLSPVDPTMFSWGPIRYSGLYLLSWTSTITGDAAQNRAFAVNMLDEFEGRIQPAEDMRLGQDTVAGQAAEASAYTALWPYAIMLCIAVLMLEWWVYHRKTYL